MAGEQQVESTLFKQWKQKQMLLHLEGLFELKEV